MTDQFAEDHEPGSMTLTASAMPCLIVPPEYRPRWAPSPLSYALHLRGDAPMPSGDAKTLRRGKLMESVGRELLRMDHSIALVAEQVRCARPDLPAVCWLDGVMAERDNWAVEMKSMTRRTYEEDWLDGPPLWTRVQAQAQQMISPELVGVLIVPIVIDTWTGNPEIPAVYEELRDENIGTMLADTGRGFLEMIHHGELPAPDETIASYDAVMRTLKLDERKAVTLADVADAAQFRWWQQAKHQRQAGEKMEEASKRYFAMRAGSASVIELPGVGRIERKQVNVSAEKQPRPERTDLRWYLKESSVDV